MKKKRVPRASSGPAQELSPGVAVGWRRLMEGPRSLLALGAVLLAVMACWWGAGLTQAVPNLPPGRAEVDGKKFTHVLIMPFAGLDFHHNYVGVRSWLRGQNLYVAMPGDPANEKYTYTPLTLAAFSWTARFAPSHRLNLNGPGGAFPFEPAFPAMLVWLTAIVSVIGWAVWQSWAARGALGLPAIPLIFVAGAVFASYPVIFEMERGNCNALPLLAILVILPALRWQRAWLGDLVAGLAVAGAIGIKPFAVVLLLGLVALRRARAAAFALVWVAVWCALLWRDVARWLEVARVTTEIQLSSYLDFSHAVISHWTLLAADLGLAGMLSLRPTLVVALVMLAPVLAVSWRMFRAPEKVALAWPFLLWLAAMATFVSPVAQDYNLLFVPLAILSLWSVRDPLWIHAIVVLALVWWQPLYLGIAGWPWLLLKTVSVMLVGGLIWHRAGAANTAATILAAARG